MEIKSALSSHLRLNIIKTILSQCILPGRHPVTHSWFPENGKVGFQLPKISQKKSYVQEIRVHKIEGLLYNHHIAENSPSHVKKMKAFSYPQQTPTNSDEGRFMLSCP